MRALGIETEYGILGEPAGNPIALSGLVVAAYAQTQGDTARVRWSYAGEDPLADARGWHHDARVVDPSLLTHHREFDRDAPMSNQVLGNGGRLYVDHAHPEYSSPEVTTALDAVRWDRAGELIMAQAQRVLADNPMTPTVALYKNNVDGKGASYGTHENYLVDRRIPFADLVAVLTPFLVTRQIMVGAGRVGLGQVGEDAGFQISQRADYIETEVALETTLRRPIINTRDEPHADAERFRRLHLIIGDANCYETATYLKLGSTSLVLDVLEAVQTAGSLPDSWRGLALTDPVASVQRVSRDLDLTAQLNLVGGGTATALEIQRAYLDGVSSVLGSRMSDAERDVVATWSRVLTRLATDRGAAAREVEWLGKLQLVEGLRQRHSLTWHSAKVAALDLQWSDLRPGRGLYAKLRDSGAVATLVSPEEVRDAVVHPPRDTRAWLRGRAVSLFPTSVLAAGWNDLVIAGPQGPRRLALADPYRGGERELGDRLNAPTTPLDVLTDVAAALESDLGST